MNAELENTRRVEIATIEILARDVTYLVRSYGENRWCSFGVRCLTEPVCQQNAPRGAHSPDADDRDLCWCWIGRVLSTRRSTADWLGLLAISSPRRDVVQMWKLEASRARVVRCRSRGLHLPILP
ncbi:unnamed protein product [Danaus chrysippus]|uniref:(African queen) hypothetical protein n=1 Tax=Danaus chrysippus TaxID=151541 RepID=A0A8J2R9L9_9NEOP|nr:unnamed protein product [Danaus chrysippus]